MEENNYIIIKNNIFKIMNFCYLWFSYNVGIVIISKIIFVVFLKYIIYNVLYYLFSKKIKCGVVIFNFLIWLDRNKC